MLQNILHSILFYLMVLQYNSNLALIPCNGYTNVVEVNEDFMNEMEGKCNKNTTITICNSFSAALDLPLNDTCIHLKSNVSLSSFKNLKFINDLKMIADKNVTLTCHGYSVMAGLSFEFCSNIIISNISVNQCSYKHNLERSTNQTVYLYTSIMVKFVKKIAFYKVSFLDISGYGIAFLDTDNADLYSVYVYHSSRAVVKNYTTNKMISNGGIFIQYQHYHFGSNSIIQITDCVFHGIKSVSKTATAAAFANLPYLKGAGVSVFVLKNNTNNSISLINCNFYNNHAEWGGGMYIYFHKDSSTNSVKINNTDFTKNIAKVSGGGIYIEDLSQSSNNLQISRSTFYRNIAVVGGGAIHAHNAIIIITDHTHIIKNYGSSVMLGASVLDVYGSLTFSSNHGSNGAAVYMYKCSTIKLHSTTNLTFVNNTATDSGGALYIFHRFIKAATRCFFDFGKNKYSTSFTGLVSFLTNTANHSGKHVYASTFNLCKEPGISRDKILQNWTNFNFLPFENGSLATAPYEIVVNRIEWKEQSLDTYFYPHILVQDEKGMKVDALLSLQVSTVNNTTKCSFDTSKETYFLDKNEPQISVAFIGSKLKRCDISISVTSEMGYLTKGFKNLGISGCLPLFHHDENGKCTCISIDSAECYGNNLYLTPNHWAFGNNVYVCPSQYCDNCKSSKDTKFKHLCLFDKYQQCSKYRNKSSNLCSRCIEGYSVTLGSEKCIKCNGSNNYKWISAVTILAVVLITLLIIGLNYRECASYVIPVVYFYQLVPSFLPSGTQMNVFDAIVFTFFNSDEIDYHSYCFIHGLDNLSKLWVHLVSSLLWPITYLICFHILKRYRFKRACTRAGSTIGVIFFLDVTKFICQCLDRVEINNYHFVYRFADEVYLGDRHLKYFVVALFTLVSIATLIVYSTFKIYHRPRIILMLDFGYKNTDKATDWFYPFYFIFIGSFVSFDNFYHGFDKTTWLTVLCLAFACSFALSMPYKNEKHNMFEMFVFANLLVIGEVSDSLVLGDTVTHQTIQYILLIPLFGLLFWIIYVLLGASGIYNKLHCRLCNTKENFILPFPQRFLIDDEEEELDNGR